MLDKELKFDRYENSFLWLKDAAVAIPSYIVTEPKSPLAISKETNVFKLFMNDVGLLSSCYPVSVKRALLEMNTDREINNGALFENFVAQEIYASTESLYYYKRKNVGEVDFLVENRQEVLSVEVKSGNNHKKHAALDHLLERYDLGHAFVLSPNNIEKEGNITYLPVYMTGLLCREDKPEGADLYMPSL